MPFSPERRKAYDAARTAESRKRNDARSQARSKNTTNFVGVDGEGVTRPDGIHEYVLLSVGAESLHHPDGSRLGTDEIFRFLWETHKPGEAYVGFFLGYDFSQWLRDLPEERARMLITDAGINKRRRKESGGNPILFPVDWGHWEFDALPGLKRFKLRPKGAKKLPWLYICDAGPMFQTSLLKAIDPSDWPVPICSVEEFALIEKGKSARGGRKTPVGKPVPKSMIKYNVLENDILARLMARVNEGLVGMDVKLKRTQWYGPGQAAQEWLKMVASEHAREAILESAADRGRLAEVTDALEKARASYFGGWFEIMAHGPIPGTVWEYDINSAYPSIIADLPCLLHGRWESGTGTPTVLHGELCLVRAHVRGSNGRIGAMPHRTPKGRVLRPSETQGWYWAHEVVASQDAGLIDTIEVFEWTKYHACSCPPPFAKIRDLYHHRTRVGKKTPQGKAMKLVYNSSYGKMAQSVGLPKYGNAVYASLITAGCRTMILDAIADHPQGADAVVMVATDGVYFTSPHPTLPLDKDALGWWDVTEKQNLSLFKPGVYWDDATRAALDRGATPKIKSRGVNAAALARVIREIDRQWDQTRPEWLASNTWPQVDLRIPFSVMSPKQALQQNHWDRCGAVTVNREVQFSANPIDKRDIRMVSHRPPYWTAPYRVDREGVESAPYERRFGMEREALEELNEVQTEDGPANILFSELLH